MVFLIPWEYLVSGLVLLLVPVILSLPLFYFIPETHKFLHGFFLHIFRMYEILQWCLEISLLFIKKTVSLIGRLPRTFLVDLDAIPQRVLVIGKRDSAKKSTTWSRKSRECQAFKGEGAQDQNGMDLSKDVAHLQEDSSVELTATTEKRLEEEKLLQEQKWKKKPTTLTGTENSGLTWNIKSLNNPTQTTEPLVDAAIDTDPVKIKVDEACAAKPKGESTSGFDTPDQAKPIVVCNGRVETASSTLKSIDYSLNKNFYHCTVDGDGGKLKLPFCILIFPAMAVLAPRALKIAVIQKAKEDGGIQVTPAIHCTDSDWCTAVQFHKPIRIEVETTTNWTGGDIEIQATESSRTTVWQKVDGVKVTRKTDSISFSLSSFTGVRAVVQQPALELYHAVFVKRPTGIINPAQQLFYVLLFSLDHDSQKNASRTLASPANEVIIERQLVVVRPPCTFKASLCISTMSSSSSEVHFEIQADCSKIHENQMIKIVKGDCSVAMQPGVPVDIEYNVWSSGSFCPKPYAFYWCAPAIPRSLSVGNFVVNANGEHSIGVHVSPEAWLMQTDRSLRPNSVPDLVHRDTSDSDTDSDPNPGDMIADSDLFTLLSPEDLQFPSL